MVRVIAEDRSSKYYSLPGEYEDVGGKVIVLCMKVLTPYIPELNTAYFKANSYFYMWANTMDNVKYITFSWIISSMFVY